MARTTNAIGVKLGLNQKRDMPTTMTNRVPKAKCFSSVKLNQKTPSGLVGSGTRGGGYSGTSSKTGMEGFSRRGTLVRQYSGHAWFSGRRCSTQKYP